MTRKTLYCCQSLMKYHWFYTMCILYRIYGKMFITTSTWQIFSSCKYLLSIFRRKWQLFFFSFIAITTHLSTSRFLTLRLFTAELLITKKRTSNSDSSLIKRIFCRLFTIRIYRSQIEKCALLRYIVTEFHHTYMHAMNSCLLAAPRLFFITLDFLILYYSHILLWIYEWVSGTVRLGFEI